MKYTVRKYQDNLYAVYKTDSDGFTPVFIGTLDEVNAWIALTEKGYL